MWYPVREHKVFEGLSLSVDENSFVVISGENGSGKTSLFRLLLGFYTPDSGSILIDGRNPARLTSKFLARHRRRVLSITSEDQFLPKSVLENVSLPLELKGVSRNRAVKKALHVLEQLALSGLSAKIPSKCSTSERRMISLARILATHPSVVLADEPFAGLDSSTRAQLMEQLIQLHQRGVTVVVATRRTEDIDYDQVQSLILSDGVIRSELAESGL